MKLRNSTFDPRNGLITPYKVTDEQHSVVIYMDFKEPAWGCFLAHQCITKDYGMSSKDPVVWVLGEERTMLTRVDVSEAVTPETYSLHVGVDGEPGQRLGQVFVHESNFNKMLSFDYWATGSILSIENIAPMSYARMPWMPHPEDQWHGTRWELVDMQGAVLVGAGEGSNDVSKAGDEPYPESLPNVKFSVDTAGGGVTGVYEQATGAAYLTNMNKQIFQPSPNAPYPAVGYTLNVDASRYNQSYQDEAKVAMKHYVVEYYRRLP